MMRASGNDLVLKNADNEDIRVVQNILDGYEKFDIKPGQALAYESVERPLMDYKDFIIDMCEAGVAKVRYAGDTREGMIIYDKDNRQNLLEQLTLLVSGQRWKELDYEDIIAILEKKCLFRCADSSEGGIVENSLSVLKELIENEGSEQDEEIEVLIQFSDCRSDSVNEFFDGMEELESDVEITAYDQEVHCWDNSMIEPDEDTYGVVSIFYPI